MPKSCTHSGLFNPCICSSKLLYRLNEKLLHGSCLPKTIVSSEKCRLLRRRRGPTRFMPDTLCQIETSNAGRTVMQRSQHTAVHNSFPSNDISYQNTCMMISWCFESQSRETRKNPHSHQNKKTYQMSAKGIFNVHEVRKRTSHHIIILPWLKIRCESKLVLPSTCCCSCASLLSSAIVPNTAL